MSNNTKVDTQFDDYNDIPFTPDTINMVNLLTKAFMMGFIVTIGGQRYSLGLNSRSKDVPEYVLVKVVPSFTEQDDKLVHIGDNYYRIGALEFNTLINLANSMTQEEHSALATNMGLNWERFLNQRKG